MGIREKREPQGEKRISVIRERKVLNRKRKGFLRKGGRAGGGERCRWKSQRKTEGEKRREGHAREEGKRECTIFTWSDAEGKKGGITSGYGKGGTS